MTITIVPTPSQRRGKVYDGIRLGCTVAAMPSLREETARWPDAYRSRPSDG